MAPPGTRPDKGESMKPSQVLDLHREAIRRIVLANDALNPRVFGSVFHGHDTEHSDLDRKQWDGLLLTLTYRRRCARMVNANQPFRG